MHKEKLRNSKLKSYVVKTDDLVAEKSDEDGVIIFQYEPQKSPWIFKKIKSLFPVTSGNASRGCGVKV